MTTIFEIANLLCDLSEWRNDIAIDGTQLGFEVRSSKDEGNAATWKD